MKSSHQNSLHTHLYNLSEDVWPFIQALSPPSRQKELDENTRLSGHEYLGLRAKYATQPLQFITPTPIDSTFLDYINGLIPGQTSVLTPPKHSGRLSSDTLKVPGLVKKIGASATLSAYCPSPSLYRLLDQAEVKNVKIIDVPTQKAWQHIAPLSTKTGLRQLVESLHDPQIKMAPGQVFPHLNPALDAASAYTTDQGVVLKTHKGHAGMGVAIFPPGKLKGNQSKRRAALAQFLQADGPYWSHFPLVVEAFIPTDISIGGGIPNVEGYVDSQGRVDIRYHCGLYILEDGTFAGTETGPKVLPKKIVDQLSYIATTIGQIYAQRGYRGVFELDTLAGLDGHLYVAESNIRRNGGTHSYNVARYFFGPKYPHTHHLITHMITVGNDLPSFDHILDKTREVLFQPGGEFGVIPTDPDITKFNPRQFGYMVLADSQKQAHVLETKFIRLLNS